MRIHTNDLGTRILGTITGIGFIAMGVFSLFGGGDALTAVEYDRAIGFGATAVVGGTWAIGASWLAADLSGIWCRPPRRWR